MQAAQAVHAAFAYHAAHPAIVDSWLPDPYLVIVTAPNEAGVIALATQARAEGITATVWHEPDMADAITACVLEPSVTARRLCAQLPLLGRHLAATG